MKSSLQLFVSFAVSTVVLLVGIYVAFGMDLPQWQLVKDARVRLAERQAVMDQLSNLVSTFQERVASFDNVNAQIELVDTALPSSLNIPELLVSIEAMAAAGEVGVESVAFSSVDVLSQRESQAAKDAKKVKLAEPLPIQVTVSGTGTYKAVKDFVRGVEQELRLMDMRSVSFRPVSVAGTTGKPAQGQELNTVFSFQMSADAYYIETPSFTLP